MSEEKEIFGHHNNEIDFADILHSLYANKIKLVLIVILFGLVGGAYSFFVPPVYQAQALLQVEKDSFGTPFSEFTSSFMQNNSSSSTEIELIKSRMILGKTIRDLDLDTQIIPQYFPFFGRKWAQLTGTPPRKLVLSQLTTETLETPLNMTLTVKDNNTFSLENGFESTEGRVGKVVTGAHFSLLVDAIHAPVGSMFLIVKNPFFDVYNALLGSLSINEKNRDTGILFLTLQGRNRQQIQSVLDSVINNYVKQNTDRRSEEAAKSLTFLNTQVPLIKESLELAENNLNNYRQRNESVDLSLEAKTILDNMVIVEADLNELSLAELEMSKLYTTNHPTYRSLIEKRKVLLNMKKDLNAKVGGMPKTQQDVLRLNRDVESSQQIYLQLINRQQELQISKASAIGHARIIDQAITQLAPIKPNKKLIVMLSILLGFFVSFCTVTLKMILNPGIKKTKQLEENGFNVYAMIPLSNTGQPPNSPLKRGKRQPVNVKLLSQISPVDPTVEAIRGLRTLLHFIMMNARNNVLMITGPTQGVGKSFISSNLAYVIAQSNLKILLIDTDMRRGYLEQVFSQKTSQSGLSTFLSGQNTTDDIVIRTSNDYLDIIPHGQFPPNPSELLMHNNFNLLLDWAKNNYDIVILDTPPILPITDAAIIGSHSGCTLLVVKYGVTTLKEVQTSYDRLTRNGIEIKGTIFNYVEKDSDEYSYAAYYTSDTENG